MVNLCSYTYIIYNIVARSQIVSNRREGGVEEDIYVVKIFMQAVNMMY